MNHTLPHPTMMSPLQLVSSIYLKGKSGHELAQIAYTKTILIISLLLSEMSNSEYQDHMDITKCIPSIKISGLSLTDPPEEQVTLVSGSLSPEGAIG